jgi:HK97 family phage portal protein
MGMLDRLGLRKLNPAQPRIADAEGIQAAAQFSIPYEKAFEKLEVVNRGINMIVDAAAQIGVDVGDKEAFPGIATIRHKKLATLLNRQPNPFQNADAFRRQIFLDLILDGNCFMYYDGVHLYHLPASNVVIHPDKKTFIKGYEYSDIKYKPEEIIHIQDNSSKSIYRGTSRLISARDTLNLLYNMRDFQGNFFKNGAVPGLVLKSPNTLSTKVKERLINSWSQRYNPKSGGRRPLVLDGGLEIDKMSDVDFKKLDFEESVKNLEDTVLRVLGIPSILLKGGNNANIRPNHRLMYQETVLPLVRKVISGLERYFGYDLAAVLEDLSPLQPELDEKAKYYSTLVNGGVITPNEAREALRLEKIEGHDDIRIPANVAGSAGNPSEGGRPTEDEEVEDEGDNE